MRNAHFAPGVREAQHENALLRRKPRGARDERRIAVELDAGGMDRGLAVRRRHHRRVLAAHRAADRGARRLERRQPVRGVNFAHMEFMRRGFDQCDAVQGQADRLKNRAAADDDRVTNRAHALVERRLDGDLGADAAGIAHGDGYFRFNRRSSRG
jgi:hypothetical protein